MPKKNFLATFIFLFLMTPFSIKAATLYLMPQSQTIYQNDTFIVEIRLDTEDEEINTLEGNLKFSPELLENVDFSKGGSFLTLWAKEPSLERGRISFLGGIPGGFRGENLILKINFLAKEIGKTDILFTEDSKVLLNDGKGTPAKLNFLEGNYEIIKKPEGLPVISSRTHSDQNKYYSQNTLHLHWDLVEGAEYSFILSKDSLSKPDNIPDRPEPKEELIWMGDMEYPNLEDGTYYFNLKQKLQDKDWSEPITFRAMIDVTSPEEFKAEIGKDPSIFEGKSFLSFATIDSTSGVDYFEIKEGKRGFKRVSSPYLLEDQRLQSKILVKAVDKAGNERISEIIPTKKPSPSWIISSILLIILMIIGWKIFKIEWFLRKLKIKK